MAYRHGKFVWRDNFTPDSEAAKAWYTGLMGWDLEEFPMGDQGTYFMFKAGGITLGGFMTMNEEMKAMGAPPHWLPYVSIDDVDAGAARAESNGGKVLVPGTDIPTVGRFSVIMDPTGGVLALFTALTEDPPAHQPPPPHGDHWWTELRTNDVEGAKAFYSEVVGWKPHDQEMGDQKYTIWMAADETPCGGCMATPPGVEAPSHWATFFAVDDVDAILGQAENNGGQVIMPAMDMPTVGRFGMIADPQGAAFGVITPDLSGKG